MWGLGTEFRSSARTAIALNNLFPPPPCFLRYVVSLSLELTDAVRLAHQQAPGSVYVHLPSTRITDLCSHTHFLVVFSSFSITYLNVISIAFRIAIVKILVPFKFSWHHYLFKYFFTFSLYSFLGVINCFMVLQTSLRLYISRGFFLNLVFQCVCEWTFSVAVSS